MKAMRKKKISSIGNLSSNHQWKMKMFVAMHVRTSKAKYYADYFKCYSNDARKQWQMIR